MTDDAVSAARWMGGKRGGTLCSLLIEFGTSVPQGAVAGDVKLEIGTQGGRSWSACLASKL